MHNPMLAEGDRSSKTAAFVAVYLRSLKFARLVRQ